MIHIFNHHSVPPSEPRDVHVTEATTSTIHVSWTEPSYGGNPYLDSYILCLNSDCQATDSSTKNLVVNLNQGQIHVINMYAISKSGNVTAQSDSSNAVCFANGKRYNDKDLLIPLRLSYLSSSIDSPHSLAFVNSGSSWAFVEWEEPSVSCQDSKYKITCNGTSHVTTTTSHNVTKLYSSTKYTCTVVAVCENSICSQKSAELTFHTRKRVVCLRPSF